MPERFRVEHYTAEVGGQGGHMYQLVDYDYAGFPGVATFQADPEAAEALCRELNADPELQYEPVEDSWWQETAALADSPDYDPMAA